MRQTTSLLLHRRSQFSASRGCRSHRPRPGMQAVLDSFRGEQPPRALRSAEVGGEKAEAEAKQPPPVESAAAVGYSRALSLLRRTPLLCCRDASDDSPRPSVAAATCRLHRQRVPRGGAAREGCAGGSRPPWRSRRAQSTKPVHVRPHDHRKDRCRCAIDSPRRAGRDRALRSIAPQAARRA